MLTLQRPRQPLPHPQPPTKNYYLTQNVRSPKDEEPPQAQPQAFRSAQSRQSLPSWSVGRRVGWP